MGLKEIVRRKMLVAIKKWEFFIKKIDFIRFVIKLGYISIDLKKVKARYSSKDRRIRLCTRGISTIKTLR